MSRSCGGLWGWGCGVEVREEILSAVALLRGASRGPSPAVSSPPTPTRRPHHTAALAPQPPSPPPPRSPLRLLHDLGRHPARGAHKGGARDLVVAPRAPALRRGRHPKVADLHAAVAIYEDVAGLGGGVVGGVGRLGAGRLGGGGGEDGGCWAGALRACVRLYEIDAATPSTPPSMKEKSNQAGPKAAQKHTFTSLWMPPCLCTYSRPFKTSLAIVAMTTSLRPCVFKSASAKR